MTRREIGSLSVKYTVGFTAKNGAEATISGDSDAISAIEDALEKAGIQYNESVECWDEGFYQGGTAPYQRRCGEQAR